MRYSITYVINGVKEIRVSPFMRSASEAVLWMYRQKPSILSDLANLQVRPWQKGDQR
jgi:hypothetical protein